MAGVRQTQVVIETVDSPSSGKVRATQVAVETVLMNQDGKVRMTQVVIETIGYYNPAAARRRANVCVIC